MIVVGCDISLSSTGVVRYTTGRPLPFGLYRVDSLPDDGTVRRDLAAWHARLQLVENRVIAAATRAGLPDLVVVEEPAIRNLNGAVMMAWNWGRVVGRFVDLGIPVMQATNQAVKIYATGSGSVRGATKVTKAMVVAAVRSRYGEQAELITSHDIADALILAAVGARMMGEPVEAALPATHLRALDKLHLPERLTRSC